MKLIKNARVNGTPDSWVLYDDKTVIAAGAGACPRAAEAADVIDASGADLIPGLTDMHVHFREPGLERKATIATESRAALLGGITTVCDMPNTSPATTTAEALRAKVEMGRSTSAVHYHAFWGAVPGCMKEVVKFAPGEIPGVKVFLGTSTGSMTCPSEAELLELMRYCASAGLPVMVHAEDNDMIAANAAEAIARYGSAAAVPVSEHHRIRSAEACLRATDRAIEMALRTGVHLHVAHVSTAEEVRRFFRPGAVADKQITAETTPMYMDPVLADEANRTSLHKINPAIKTPDDAAALREAVLSGAIDTIGTDHAPHLPADKIGGALTAASGAPSIQFALAMMLEYLPLDVIVERMTAAPHAIFGLGSAGRIESGVPSDLVVVAPSEQHIITDSEVVSLCGWTPFVGRTVRHSVRPLSVARQ